MSRMMRILKTGYSDASTNMAIDEAILVSSAHREGAPPTLRFYGWKPPAVSIGYFQSLAGEVDLDRCRKLGVGWVRRPTGGRAVLHADEVTYSIVISEADLPGSVLETYRELSKGLIEGFRRLGVPADMVASGHQDLGPLIGQRSSAACFDAPSWYEVVVGGKKIVGSAQTRRDGVILQHGSILLDFDVGCLLEVLAVPGGRARERLARVLEKRATSLREVLGVGNLPSFDQVVEAMVLGFEKALGYSAVPGVLTREEEDLAARLAAGKYGSDTWNRKR